MSDDELMQTLEVDLDVAECIEILEAHGVTSWTPELVTHLWDWKEADRCFHEDQP